MKPLIFALLLLFNLTAFAGTTVFGGVDHSTDQGAGTWYQTDYPYTEKLNSYVLGARYDQCKDGWCKGGGIISLGHFSVSALADPNDADYQKNPRLYPPSHFNGSGGTWGFFGTVGKQFGAFTVEAGISLLKPSWVENSPDWRQYPDSAPQNITVSHRSHFQLAPMAGIQYHLDDHNFIELSVWNTASHGDEWVSLFKRTYAFTFNRTF